MKSAAIYARVSSERQKEEQTIRSQTSALEEAAKEQDYLVPSQWIFEDEGYSGAVLVRPGLDRIRDLAAEGQIEQRSKEVAMSLRRIFDGQRDLAAKGPKFVAVD